MSCRKKIFLSWMLGVVFTIVIFPTSASASIDNGVFVSNKMIEKEYPIALEATLPNAIDGFAPLRNRGIIDGESRELVGNTEMYPYSTIVQLSITFPNGVSTLGTGSMVSGDTVLTAAHCLYNASRGGWASSVVVMPGRQEWTLPFGRYSADEFYVLSSYLQPGNGLNSDIGLVKLKEDIGGKTGWLGMSAESLNENNYTLTGYPGDLGMYYMYTEERTIPSSDWTTEFYVHHNHDSFSGQSGSPLYETDSKRTVAVHSGSNDTSNFATRLTRKRLVAIYDIAFPQKEGVESIVLTPESALLEKNETLQLTATITPENATNKEVTWTSSNPDVATVSATGLVTTKTAGTATITATAADSGKKATSIITVDDHSDKKDSATDITSQNKIEGTIEESIQNKADVDYFKYIPKYTGVYRIRNGNGKIVKPSIVDEVGEQPHSGSAWAGDCFYFEENKTYFIKIDKEIVKGTGAYSYSIENPFEDPYLETFPCVFRDGPTGGGAYGTAFSGNLKVPAVRYNLHVIPSDGVIKLYTDPYPSVVNGMTVSVEVYNENKEKIAETTLVGRQHSVDIEVSAGQRFYTKVMSENSELRGSFLFGWRYLQRVE